MTTLALSSVLAQTSSVTFQAWVAEVVAALFVSLGVTQTADTGQINPATVAVPGAANTSAGYVIGRFNDTLQSTAPIFFKLEFGSGSAASNPAMWLTVGTGSNGSGTITGTGGAITTRCMVTNGGAPSSTITAFTSRYVYLATAQAGFLGVMFKYGATNAAVLTATIGGFFIFRTTDASGNASGQGALVLTTAPSATAPGNTTSNGVAQTISYSTASLIPATPANGWESCDRSFLVWNLNSLLEASTSFVCPIYTVDPVVRFSAYMGTAVAGDFAPASTASIALVGGTPMTFISAGQPFGCSTGFNSHASTFFTLVVPWQ